MISRTGKDNFIVAHYDWVVAGIGAVAVLGAVAFCLFGGNVEEEIGDAVASVEGRGAVKADVAAADMTAYAAMTNAAKARAAAEAVEHKSGVFFASEKRILCSNPVCGRAMSARLDAAKNLVCSICGYTQEVAKAEKVADSDGDGLPDEWEKRYGLNPNDASDANADADGDEFTNLEEYVAKTDPKDPKDHPDYLDSLKIVLPLKETSMPFAFRKATKVPAGWRCEFFDPARKDDYGRKGKVLTAIVGEEIVDKDLDAKKALKSGYVLKSYTAKSEKRAIPGSELKKTVDVSEAVVERKSDGKLVTLVIQEGKTVKLASVDVQATLSYERGQVKNFDVVPGTEIVLSGTKYRISEIKADGKGAKVTVEDVLTKTARVLAAP